MIEEILSSIDTVPEEFSSATDGEKISLPLFKTWDSGLKAKPLIASTITDRILLTIADGLLQSSKLEIAEKDRPEKHIPLIRRQR